MAPPSMPFTSTLNHFRSNISFTRWLSILHLLSLDFRISATGVSPVHLYAFATLTSALFIPSLFESLQRLTLYLGLICMQVFQQSKFFFQSSSSTFSEFPRPLLKKTTFFFRSPNSLFPSSSLTHSSRTPALPYTYFLSCINFTIFVYTTKMTPRAKKARNARIICRSKEEKEISI